MSGDLQPGGSNASVSDGFLIAFPAEVVEHLVEAVAERVLERLPKRDTEGNGWPEWMGVETAARYLDVPVERLRKLQARRALPYSQEAPGCRVFFSRVDLDAWMASSRHAPRGAA